MKIMKGIACDSCEDEAKTCIRFRTHVFQGRSFFDICFGCLRRAIILALGGEL